MTCTQNFGHEMTARTDADAPIFYANVMGSIVEVRYITNLDEVLFTTVHESASVTDVRLVFADPPSAAACPADWR
jgi:hypothetical protein